MRIVRKIGWFLLWMVVAGLVAACEPEAENGGFAVELSWSGNADLDLMVTVPDGERITYANPSAGGGTLTADARGFCQSAGSNPVERVAFPAEGGAPGEYYVTVSYALACGEPAPVTWQLTVHNGDEIIQRSGQLQPGESIPIGRFLRG